MNTQRRFDLDWVRIAAFALLIFYHVGMYYVTWDWHIKSPHAATTLEPLMILSAPWRLSLLFLVSGVATAYLLAKSNTDGFLGRRSLRLLVPLAFGMLVIVPPQSYLQVVERLHYAGSFAQFYRLYVDGYHGFCDGDDCLRLPTWNHLWFVAYLWAYTVVLYAIVRVFPRLMPRLRTLAETRLAGLGVVFWPIAFLALARIALVGSFPQNHALAGDWYNHAQYLPIFALGFVLAATQAPWNALEQARWGALATALLSWVALCVYYSFYDDANPPPLALKEIMRVVYAAVQWPAIVAVLGFARRHWSHDNAARRYLTTAIFPVYILHQTVIILAAHALKPADLNPVFEGLLLVAITGVSCLIGYECIRRVPLLRPLFGLDFRPKAQAAPTLCAPAATLHVYSDTH
jgi:glucan biosynthesis protein C